MKWSFIVMLPALVTALWAMVTLFVKRRPTRAQVAFCLSQLLLAFTLVVLDVFFRGRAGKLFIYDFLLQLVAVLCGPLFYTSLCSLTEPRGTTLKQRRSFLVPLMFIVALTIGAFWLGPRRYEMLCIAIRDGEAGLTAGDEAWNYLYIVRRFLFPVLIIAVNTIFAIFSTQKIIRFEKRFNSYYAADIKVPQINSRIYTVCMWIFIPLALSMILIIDHRPYLYKYWMIACAVLMTVVQYLIGWFVYRLDYDARYLAEYIRVKG